MKISIQSFKGVAPRINPRYLPDGGAQVALNVEAFGQSLKPLDAPAATALALGGSTSAKTLYCYTDETTGTNYWWKWNAEVDVCRSQIAGDSNGWTFYSGDGEPKATYRGIAAELGTAAPKAYRRLGIPGPTVAPTATAAGFTTELPQYKPSLLIPKTAIDTLRGQADLDLSVKLEGGADYGTLSATVSSAVATVVTLTASDIAAMTAAYGVQISVSGTDYTTCPLTINSSNAEPATVTLTSTDWGALALYSLVQVSVDQGVTWVSFNFYGVGVPISAQIVAEAFNRSAGALITATVVDTTSVKLVTKTTGAQATLLVRCSEWGSDKSDQGTAATGGATAAAVAASINKYAVASFPLAGTIPLATAVVDGTQVLVTLAMIDMPGLWVRWGPEASHNKHVLTAQITLADVTTAINALRYDPSGVNLQLFVATNRSDGVEVTTGDIQAQNRLPLSGPTCVMSIAISTVTVDAGVTGNAFSGQARGTQGDPGPTETRVYVYTLVYSEAGFTWESQPSPPSELLTLYIAQLAQVSLPYPSYLSSWHAFPAGTLTCRLYRSVNGVYLLVKDGLTLDPEGDDPIVYDDGDLAEELGEPCPSVDWEPPLAGLKGLINMPNGLVAGFVGRDVYFCEPYRPYAWPSIYAQTLDYQIVGLGRMDTTLAVLTEGVPYLIQGSSPEGMVVVKSDLEQACVSKRSIVSMDGYVYYASPDGLIALYSGGSKNITAELFSREDWQKLKPSSIHAYGHDGKYYGFYDTGSVTGGFVVDLANKQFIKHGLYYRAGHNVLVEDTLYLLESDGDVVKWGLGSAMTTGKWRSKIFSLPQITGFSCAQVEAQSFVDAAGNTVAAYPAEQVCRIYCDNSATPILTQTLTSRAPFRLPAVQGRDWEIELDVKSEIFNVVLAQAMSEIATA